MYWYYQIWGNFPLPVQLKLVCVFHTVFILCFEYVCSRYNGQNWNHNLYAWWVLWYGSFQIVSHGIETTYNFMNTQHLTNWHFIHKHRYMYVCMHWCTLICATSLPQHTHLSFYSLTDWDTQTHTYCSIYYLTLFYAVWFEEQPIVFVFVWVSYMHSVRLSKRLQLDLCV